MLKRLFNRIIHNKWAVPAYSALILLATGYYFLIPYIGGFKWYVILLGGIVYYHSEGNTEVMTMDADKYNKSIPQKEYHLWRMGEALGIAMMILGTGLTQLEYLQFIACVLSTFWIYQYRFMRRNEKARNRDA